MLTREQALKVLRRHEPELRARGVRRAAVFGSVARGEARRASDLDVLVEIDPAARLTVFDYVAVKRVVAELFSGPVDVVNANALKPAIARTALRDAAYEF